MSEKIKEKRKWYLDWILNSPVSMEHEEWLNLSETDKDEYRKTYKQRLLSEISGTQMCDFLDEYEKAKTEMRKEW